MSKRIAKYITAGELNTMEKVGQPPNQQSIPVSGKDFDAEITRDTRNRLVRLAYRFLWSRDDVKRESNQPSN